MKISSKYQPIFALAIWLFLFWFLGYFEILGQGPLGLHIIRQTDSFTFVDGYLRNGFDFFEPCYANLENEDGRAASEFPIIHYLSALFYAIVGKGTDTPRLAHHLILSLGFYCSFLALLHWLRDKIMAALVVLLLIGSTVVNYYSFNYLPDAPALGFALIGGYFFSRFLKFDARKSLVWSCVFLALAALFKVTYALFPIALFATVFLGKYLKLGVFSTIRNKNKVLLFGAGALIIPAAWAIYSLWYNNLYDQTYFLSHARPIWSLSSAQIADIRDHMWNYWYSDYLALSTFHFFVVCLAFIAVFFNRIPLEFKIFSAVLILGLLSYFFLFFEQFKQHDYYTLAFAPLFLLVFGLAFYLFEKLALQSTLVGIVRCIILVLVIAGINHSRNKLHKRYVSRDTAVDRVYYLLKDPAQNELKKAIPAAAKILVLPDNTKTCALYELNKTGWAHHEQDAITAEKINRLKKDGMTHILVTKKDNKYLSPVSDFEAIFENEAFVLLKVD